MSIFVGPPLFQILLFPLAITGFSSDESGFVDNAVIEGNEQLFVTTPSTFPDLSIYDEGGNSITQALLRRDVEIR